MKFEYKKLGELIELSEEKNKDLTVNNLVGININKEFIPSVANVIGTDLSKYKIVKKNQFACNLMHIGRDEVNVLSLYSDDSPSIISPAYRIFQVSDNDILNPEFLMLSFFNPTFDRLCWFYTDSSIRGSLDWSQFCKIEVPCPPIEIQEKIINIYNFLNKKIKIKEKINHNLYSLLINYFNEIFDDANKNCKLSDIVNIRRGASPRPIKDYISSTGINWLKISDVTGTEMPFIYKIKEKIIEEGKSKSVFIEKGTLVVSNSATPGIPKFIMVDTCVHDGWLVLNEYEENLRYYLYFLIVKIRKELINLAYGSVFNNLKTDTLKNYEISKPKNDQLDKFNKVAKPIMENINSNTKEILMLSKLQDALLPKLISGEIDISKINCDL